MNIHLGGAVGGTEHCSYFNGSVLWEKCFLWSCIVAYKKMTINSLKIGVQLKINLNNVARALAGPSRLDRDKGKKSSLKFTGK